MTNTQFKQELKKEVDLAFMKLDADDMRTGIPDWDTESHGGLTKNNYANLWGLLNFANNHPELSNRQITEFIKGKECFKFLNKFIAVLPNTVEELKFYGIEYCIMSYVRELECKKLRKQEKANFNVAHDTYGFK